jgi:uncharacterized Zn finger protein
VNGFGQLDLWRLAGKSSYERGEGYVEAVVDLRPTADGVRATVHGYEPYRVSLSWADGRLVGDCSCPYGAEGAFCEHCVAVGLNWIDGDTGEQPTAPSADELREYVQSLDHGTLVDLLCEQAADDEVLHQRLSLQAARDRNNGTAT